MVINLRDATVVPHTALENLVAESGLSRTAVHRHSWSFKPWIETHWRRLLSPRSVSEVSFLLEGGRHARVLSCPARKHPIKVFYHVVFLVVNRVEVIHVGVEKVVELLWLLIIDPVHGHFMEYTQRVHHTFEYRVKLLSEAHLDFAKVFLPSNVAREP